MNERDRIRGVALLCCHCVRNIAYFQAGWYGERLVPNRDFWVNTNGNCLDLAVLEWCKLFADKRGKHHWSKVLGEQGPFLASLCYHINITAEQLESYTGSVKHYRDKFVAHLDEERRMNIPELELARRSAAYLFHTVRAEHPETLSDAPVDLDRFYEERKAHAQEEHRLAT